MEIKLHSNATTTPKVRNYIQTSTKSDSELAEQFSVSLQTIRKWRKRSSTFDRSHTPHTVNRRLSFEQEALIVYLRIRLNLSLDELLKATHSLINQQISRAALARSLQKLQINRVKKTLLPQKIGDTFLDIIQLPKSISKNKEFLLILVEKLTGFISFACLDQKQTRLDGIINYYQNMLPYQITSIEGQKITLVETICNRLSVPYVFQKTNEQLSFSFQKFDQNKDFTEILCGTFTDARLGIDALLLMYEDYLNAHLSRTRLQKKTAISYLQFND
ncbi:hypothetical protein ACIRXL_07725 [Avibacterium paragallinarum]|uniref:hypothetical protein n=1 Tax=Avibacterium paragallinarum TaxID=728 RepID=UPI00397B80C6